MFLVKPFIMTKEGKTKKLRRYEDEIIVIGYKLLVDGKGDRLWKKAIGERQEAIGKRRFWLERSDQAKCREYSK